jgi:integrase
MGRPRKGVKWTSDSGRVYVRESSKGKGYTVIVSGGGPEHSRIDLEDAKKLGARLELDYSALNGATPMFRFANKFLVEDRPVAWSEAWADLQQGLWRKWFRPIYGVPGRDLRPDHVDDIIRSMRAAHRSRENEKRLRGLWGRLVKAAKKAEVIPRDRDLDPTVPLRADTRVRVHGEEGRVITRADLPTHEQICDVARWAAELTGNWWEELRVLFLAYVGPRFGDAASLTGKDYDAVTGDITFSWSMREVGGLCYELDYNKTGEQRTVSVVRQLRGLMARRKAEIGPDELFFPGENTGKWGGRGPANWQHDLSVERLRELTKTEEEDTPPAPRAHVTGQWMSRYVYNHSIWLRAGQRANLPVKARRNDRKRSDYRVTSLVWHPHDLRHCCATWLIQPREYLADGVTPNDERWFWGRGMKARLAANYIGAAEPTFTSRYVGRSAATREQQRAFMD